MTAARSHQSALSDLASGAQKALTPALGQVQHLALQASETAAPLVEQARHTVAGALQQGVGASPRFRQAADKAKGVQMDAKQIAAQIAAESAKHAAKLEKQTAGRLDAQEKALQELEMQVQMLAKTRASRGGGFPWTLVLLLGAGVYVWRTPNLRSRVLGLLGQVSPEARDTVEKVGDQAQKAVQNVQGGQRPGEAVKDAAQNVGQQVRDTAQDVGQQARGAAQDVKRGMQNASDDARRAAQDVKDDLNRNR